MYVIRHTPTKSFYGLFSDKTHLVMFKKKTLAKTMAGELAYWKHIKNEWPPNDTIQLAGIYEKYHEFDLEIEKLSETKANEMCLHRNWNSLIVEDITTNKVVGLIKKLEIDDEHDDHSMLLNDIWRNALEDDYDQKN